MTRRQPITIYAAKAVLFGLIAIAHIVLWRHLPNLVLAAVIAALSLLAMAVNISRYMEHESRDTET